VSGRESGRGIDPTNNGKGRALQFDPMKRALTALGAKRSNLNHDKLHSHFAFNLNLRRYTKAAAAATDVIAIVTGIAIGIATVTGTTVTETGTRSGAVTQTGPGRAWQTHTSNARHVIQRYSNPRFFGQMAAPSSRGEGLADIAHLVIGTHFETLL
jgi:hypothetical protein